MSAFIVDKAHIDAMVRAGLGNGHDTLTWYFDGELHKLTHSNASQVGAMLWAENVRSVNYRYSPPGREQIYGEGWESGEDFEMPGRYKTETIAPGIEIEVPEWVEPYVFPLGKVHYREPVVVLKAISCFDYQSCETPDWRESQAFAFCEALRDRMIGRLPGYDEAPWGL